MTRLAVLADIHGNLPALDAIIAHMAQFEPDAVVVAGDLINLAPYSAEVLARVFDLGWAAIRGNHEYYLLDYQTPREPASWAGYTTPPWLRKTIPVPLQRRVAALPDTLMLTYPDAPPLRVIHGYPHTPWEGMYPSTSDAEVIAAVAPVTEATIICGHIHLPQERRLHLDGRAWHIINPGSAGLAEHGTPGEAPYVILESHPQGWQAAFHCVPYDNRALLDALASDAYREAHGPFARLYEAEFRAASVRVWPFQTWRRIHHPDQPVTDSMVDDFLSLGMAMRQYVPDDFPLGQIDAAGR
jgi:predicted phosphodiesterase